MDSLSQGKYPWGIIINSRFVKSFSGFFAIFRAKMRLLCFAKTGFDFMLSFSPFRVKTGLEPKYLKVCSVQLQF